MVKATAERAGEKLIVEVIGVAVDLVACSWAIPICGIPVLACTDRSFWARARLRVGSLLRE